MRADLLPEISSALLIPSKNAENLAWRPRNPSSCELLAPNFSKLPLSSSLRLWLIWGGYLASLQPPAMEHIPSVALLKFCSIFFQSCPEIRSVLIYFLTFLWSYMAWLHLPHFLSRSDVLRCGMSRDFKPKALVLRRSAWLLPFIAFSCTVRFDFLAAVARQQWSIWDLKITTKVLPWRASSLRRRWPTPTGGPSATSRT